jgi:hypothetical protein
MAAPELDITRLEAFGPGLPRTLSRLRDRGLCMPCLNTPVRLVEPDAGRWAGMLEAYSRYAALATWDGFASRPKIAGDPAPAGALRRVLLARRTPTGLSPPLAGRPE